MNFMGIIGHAMKGGGEQATEYLQEEQKAQRLAALEAQRAANEEARYLRLEEIRAAREETLYQRRRADAVIDEAAAFDRSVDPERVSRRAEAAQLEAGLTPSKPVPLPAGGQLVDPKTGEVIANNTNVTRKVAQDKLPPMTARILDRLDKDDDAAEREAADIRKSMREAADPETKKTLQTELADVQKRKQATEARRYREIIKHDPEVYLGRDMGAVRGSVKSIEEFNQRLREIEQVTGSKEYAARVGRGLLEEGFVGELERMEQERPNGPADAPKPPPGATHTGSDARTSAAAGILQEPVMRPDQKRGFFGDTSVFASRRPGAMGEQAPLARAPQTAPEAPIIATAAVPQMTGDRATGLPYPTPAGGPAEDGVTRLGQRAPGVDPSGGDWDRINASVRANEAGAHADRLAILQAELADPNLSEAGRAALRTEIAAVTNPKDYRGRTKWNAPVIDAAAQGMDLLNPQDPATIPGLARAKPQATAPIVGTTPAKAKKELAARGADVTDDQFTVLQAKAARTEPRATVTDTRGQQRLTQKAEAQAISPRTIAEMTPAEAKEKLSRLTPVLNPAQYRALWMRSRG